MSYYTLRNRIITDAISELERFQGRTTYQFTDQQIIEEELNDLLFARRYTNQIYNYHVTVGPKNYPDYDKGLEAIVKIKYTQNQQDYDEFVLFVLPDKFEATTINNTINEDPKEAYKRAMSIL